MALGDGGTAEGVIPSVDVVAKRALHRAPRSVQQVISSGLAALSWIGLPSTVLSVVSDLQWVVDAGLWVYRHTGALKPAIVAVAHAVSLVVDVWRGLTHPLWHALAVYWHVALPNWAPDVLTIAALLLIGQVRAKIRFWIGAFGRAHLITGASTYRDYPDDLYQPLPKSFAFERELAARGLRWTPHRLARAKLLWRRWSVGQRLDQWKLAHIDKRKPTLPKWPVPLTVASFHRYLAGDFAARRIRILYFLSGLVLIAAYVIDWVYRAHS